LKNWVAEGVASEINDFIAHVCVTLLKILPGLESKTESKYLSGNQDVRSNFIAIKLE
jgi:hypothetical protein